MSGYQETEETYSLGRQTFFLGQLLLQGHLLLGWRSSRRGRSCLFGLFRIRHVPVVLPRLACRRVDPANEELTSSSSDLSSSCHLDLAAGAFVAVTGGARVGGVEVPEAGDSSISTRSKSQRVTSLCVILRISPQSSMLIDMSSGSRAVWYAASGLEVCCQNSARAARLQSGTSIEPIFCLRHCRPAHDDEFNFGFN